MSSDRESPVPSTKNLIAQFEGLILKKTRKNMKNLERNRMFETKKLEAKVAESMRKLKSAKMSEAMRNRKMAELATRFLVMNKNLEDLDKQLTEFERWNKQLDDYVPHRILSIYKDLKKLPRGSYKVPGYTNGLPSYVRNHSP